MEPDLLIKSTDNFIAFLITIIVELNSLSPPPPSPLKKKALFFLRILCKVNAFARLFALKALRLQLDVCHGSVLCAFWMLWHCLGAVH